MPKKILLVDDDPFFRNPMHNYLNMGGSYHVFSVVDGLEALKALEREHYDLIITNIKMPKINGIELLVKVKIKFPLMPVIIMSAMMTEDMRLSCLENGALAALGKQSEDIDELTEILYKQIKTLNN